MFGEQFKELRISYRLSQVDVAKALNVSKQTVSNWENNNIMPSIDKLCDIAHYFSCTTDYLLGLDKNRTFIEITDMNTEQISHIQQIIHDIQSLNKLSKSNKL